MRRSPSSCSSTCCPHGEAAPRAPADTDSFTLPVPPRKSLRRWWGRRGERVNKAISLFVRLEWLELEGRNHYRILDRQAIEDRGALTPFVFSARSPSPGDAQRAEKSLHEERTGLAGGGARPSAVGRLDRLGEQGSRAVGVAGAGASEERTRQIDAVLGRERVPAALCRGAQRVLRDSTASANLPSTIAARAMAPSAAPSNVVSPPRKWLRNGSRSTVRRAAIAASPVRSA